MIGPTKGIARFINSNIAVQKSDLSNTILPQQQQQNQQQQPTPGHHRHHMSLLTGENKNFEQQLAMYR